jgi:phosphocarrier protein
VKSVVRDLKIQNTLGLHARAAALLVQTVGKFQSEIWLSKDGRKVNGKSIMGVMSLAAAQGSRVRAEAEGEDAEELLEALEALFKRRFNEE